MPYNFLPADRDQVLLLPPDLKNWLPEDHLAWFVLACVKQMDLSSFFAHRRADGHGRAAFHPEMMVALLLYAYCVGERSSRGIERRCIEDVAFRVIAANSTPDHSTIARFLQAHDEELAGLFGETLRLCARAGLIRVGVVAIDGTRMEANASDDKNYTAEQIEALVERTLAQHKATDAEEDDLFGERRGDELPEQLTDPTERVEWLRKARAQLEAEDAAAETEDEARLAARAAQQERGRKPRGRKPKRRKGSQRGRPKRINVTDPDCRSMHSSRGWISGYNGQAVVTAEQIVIAAELTNSPSDAHHFEPMLELARTNLDASGIAEHLGTVVADAGYMSERNAATKRSSDVLIAPGSNKAMRTGDLRKPKDRSLERQRRIEALNAQTDRRVALIERAVSEGWGLARLAAELGVVVSRASALRKRFIAEGRDGLRPGNMPAPLAPPSPTAREAMAERLATERGRATYTLRSSTIEPVFGQIKEARGMRRMQRRGLSACATEWLMIMTTHNLRKLAALGSELGAGAVA